MKLGFWNRLAIVATVLALLVAPITLMVLMFTDIADAVSASYRLCLSAASNGPVNQITTAMDECNDEMSAGHGRASAAAYSWSTWFSLATGTLVFCAAVYALIWAVAATARWVWRGREKPE